MITHNSGSIFVSVFRLFNDCFFLKLNFFPVNTADFFQEIISSLRFFVDYIRGKPFTSSKGLRDDGKTNFGEAFGVTTTSKEPEATKQMTPEISAEQAVLLESYPFKNSSTKNGDV